MSDEFPVPDAVYPLIFLTASLIYTVSFFGYFALLFLKPYSEIARSRPLFLSTVHNLAFVMQAFVIMYNFLPQPYPYCFVELILWKLVMPRSTDVLFVIALVLAVKYFLSLKIADDYAENMLGAGVGGIESQDEERNDNNNNQTQPIEKKQKASHRFIGLIERFVPNPELLTTTKYICIIFFSVELITFIPSFVGVIQSLASHSDLEDACESDIVNYGNYTTGIGSIAVCITVPIILRHAKDNLYRTTEINAFASTGLIGLFAFVLTFNKNTTWLGYWLVLLITLAMQSMSFGFIPFMAFLEAKRNIQSGEASSSIGLASSRDDDRNNSCEIPTRRESSQEKVAEPETKTKQDEPQNTPKIAELPERFRVKQLEDEKLPIFSKSPFVYHMLQDIDGSKAIFAFARQQNISPFLFLFVQSVLKYKNTGLGPDSLLASAIIILKKYLGDASKTQCKVYLEDDLQEEYELMANEFDAHTDVEAKKFAVIDIDYFNRALKDVESLLESIGFSKAFGRSLEYKEFARERIKKATLTAFSNL